MPQTPTCQPSAPTHAIETTTAVFSYAAHTLDTRPAWFAEMPGRATLRTSRISPAPWLDLVLVQVVLDTPREPREG
jgi:hypothetical protein